MICKRAFLILAQLKSYLFCVYKKTKGNIYYRTLQPWHHTGCITLTQSCKGISYQTVEGY